MKNGDEAPTPTLGWCQDSQRGTDVKFYSFKKIFIQNLNMVHSHTTLGSLMLRLVGRRKAHNAAWESACACNIANGLADQMQTTTDKILICLLTATSNCN